MKTSKRTEFSQNRNQHYKIYTFQQIESSNIIGTTFKQCFTAKTQHFSTSKVGVYVTLRLILRGVVYNIPRVKMTRKGCRALQTLHICKNALQDMDRARGQYTIIQGGNKFHYSVMKIFSYMMTSSQVHNKISYLSYETI